MQEGGGSGAGRARVVGLREALDEVDFAERVRYHHQLAEPSKFRLVFLLLTPDYYVTCPRSNLILESVHILINYTMGCGSTNHH